MATIVRERVAATKERIIEKSEGKTKVSGWVLEKEKASFADEGSWSNIDLDVTPLDRRTWDNWTLFGFWLSDALNAQGWEAPSSIIAAGLTWREAVYLSRFFFSFLVSIPHFFACSLKIIKADIISYHWLHDGYRAIDAERNYRRPLSHSIPSCRTFLVWILLLEICRGGTNDHSSILAW